MSRKGYIPLMWDNLAAIGWQGEYLRDFWMWNRKFTEYDGGIRHIRTVRVTDLRSAAIHYWRDGWIPVRPIDEGFLRRMEQALREHKGLMKAGIRFPDRPFLKMPEPIPEDFLGPEVREHLKLGKSHTTGLRQKTKVPEKVLDEYRRERLAAMKFKDQEGLGWR